MVGGNFWQGAVTGLVVAGLNHVMHMGKDEDPTKPKVKPKSAKLLIDENLTGFGTGLTGVSTYGTLLEKSAIANSKYIYKFGTTIATAAKLTVDNKLFQLNVAKYSKIGGKVCLVAGIAVTAYQVTNDVNNGKYCSAGTRAAVFAVALSATAIPVVGWGVALGIGVADAIWGDQFYNYVETKMHN